MRQGVLALIAACGLDFNPPEREKAAAHAEAVLLLRDTAVTCVGAQGVHTCWGASGGLVNCPRRGDCRVVPGALPRCADSVLLPQKTVDAAESPR